MSFTTAALVLAWLAIVLLGCGFAALLQQVRTLQAALRLPAAARDGVPEAAAALAPTTAERRYVLTVDPDCGYCHDVLPRFRQLAALYATVAEFGILAASGEYPPPPASTSSSTRPRTTNWRRRGHPACSPSARAGC